MINSAVIVGNLTRDAEIKYTASGTAAVRFSIAVNRRKKSGESWVDEAMFFEVQMMGKGAEAVHRYLVKGKKVGVQGELRQDRWEQDGQPRSKVYIFASQVELLGAPASGNGGSQEGQYHGSGSQFEDDIPF